MRSGMRRMGMPVFLVLALAWGAAPSSAGKRPAGGGGRLAIPKNSGIKAKWLVPPRKGNKRPAGRLRFAVDGAGSPIVGTEDRWVARPIRGMVGKLNQAFNDMAAVRKRGLVFCTKKDLGLIPQVREIRKDKKGDPIFPFQPIAALPVRDCRLFSGAGDVLYVAGRARDSRRSQVYRLRFSKPGAKKRRPVWELLYSSNEPVAAVAGDGKATYVATGKLVVRLKKGKKKPEGFFLHPKEDILDLAYSPKAGLFYATQSGVGLVGPKARGAFLQDVKTQIRVREGALYVLFEDTLGVLKITGLEGFSRPAKRKKSKKSRKRWKR